MKRSTFLRLVLATLLVVTTYIGYMEAKRNAEISDEELAMMYTIDRFGNGNYEIEIEEIDDKYITFTSYEDGEAQCCVKLNKEYYTNMYKD